MPRCCLLLRMDSQVPVQTTRNAPHKRTPQMRALTGTPKPRQNESNLRDPYWPRLFPRQQQPQHQHLQCPCRYPRHQRSLFTRASLLPRICHLFCLRHHPRPHCVRLLKRLPRPFPPSLHQHKQQQLQQHCIHNSKRRPSFNPHCPVFS